MIYLRFWCFEIAFLNCCYAAFIYTCINFSAVTPSCVDVPFGTVKLLSVVPRNESLIFDVFDLSYFFLHRADKLVYNKKYIKKLHAACTMLELIFVHYRDYFFYVFSGLSFVLTCKMWWPFFVSYLCRLNFHCSEI